MEKRTYIQIQIQALESELEALQLHYRELTFEGNERKIKRQARYIKDVRNRIHTLKEVVKYPLHTLNKMVIS